MLFSFTNAGWLAGTQATTLQLNWCIFFSCRIIISKKTRQNGGKKWKKRSPRRERMLKYSNEMEHTCSNKFSCHMQNKNILSTMSLWLSHTHTHTYIYTNVRLFVTTLFILSVESFGFQHQIISITRWTRIWIWMHGRSNYPWFPHSRQNDQKIVHMPCHSLKRKLLGHSVFISALDCNFLE